MAGRLDGKVALVSGAGSCGPGWGNGRASATLFAREGAKVFAVDLDQDALENTAKTIRDEGNECTTHRCNVTKADEVKAMVDACIAAYGRIDVLHNNVGGSAAGGAILGRVLTSDKSKGTAIGAILGAAVGTAVASRNGDDPVVIEPGTPGELRLDSPVDVAVPLDPGSA